MAEDKKPGVPIEEQPPEEQKPEAVVPEVLEGPPAPENKVIDLSSVRLSTPI